MADFAPSVVTAQQPSRWGLTALFAGALAIGFSGIWIRLSELEPTATSFYRLAFALPFLWVWWGSTGNGGAPGSRRRLRAADYLWICAAGLLFAADMMTWAWAVEFTTVANATLFANFAPVIVTLGGWLLFGERVTAPFLAGLAVALAGAALLLGVSMEMGETRLAGDGLGLLAAVFYGGYLLTVSRLRARFPTGAIMAVSAAAGACVLLPATLFMQEGLVAATAFGWLVLLGFALTGQVAGHGLIAWALAHLPASFGSVGLLIQPVAAGVFAWTVLGEALGPWQLAGGAVVLAGIACARQGSRRS